MMNKDVPELLKPKNALFAKHFSSLVHPLRSIVERLLYVSDYATRQIPHLQHLLNEDDCQLALQEMDYYRLVSLIPLESDAPTFARSLRHFRQRHLLRLLLRELGHLASTEETISDTKR